MNQHECQYKAWIDSKILTDSGILICTQTGASSQGKHRSFRGLFKKKHTIKQHSALCHLHYIPTDNSKFANLEEVHTRILSCTVDKAQVFTLLDDN
jgi:hypothetical protein